MSWVSPAGANSICTLLVGAIESKPATQCRPLNFLGYESESGGFHTAFNGSRAVRLANMASRFRCFIDRQRRSIRCIRWLKSIA
jgi:hypothetical protein